MSAPAATINHAMSAREWALLLTLAVLWGGSYFYIAVAVAVLPPFTLVAMRVALAALVLVAVLRLSGARLPAKAAIWGAFATVGVLNNVIPFSLIAWGQTQIPSGLAAILNATTPLFTILVAHLMTDDEKMTGPRLAGVAVGFAGAVAMIGPDALAGLGTNLLAQIACLGAALGYAVSSVYARRFRRLGVAPLTSAAGQMVMASAMLVPLAVVVDRPWTLPMPGPEVWGSVIGLAVFSTALAYIILYRIIGSAGAVNFGLVTFLVPVTAILLGTLVLGERLEPRHFLGMGLIALGLAAIDGRALRRLRGG